MKERILEYLAVQKRVRQARKALLLNVVGPPGCLVEPLLERSTELGRLARKYIGMSLGGVGMDILQESRGHRHAPVLLDARKNFTKALQSEGKNPLFLF